MYIGIIRDRKKDENRVALQPHQVTTLCQAGHTVYVEAHSGDNSGFTDEEYVVAGAKVVEKEKLFEDCELLVKVKSPIPEEYGMFTDRHTLFTYLHYDENFPVEKINQLIGTGLTSIAYEWVEVNGKYPLLEPMSRLTGYLFAQKTAELCTRYKGKMCGQYESFLQNPATALVVGAGTIGVSALNYFMHNRYRIVLMDKHPDTVNVRLNQRLETSGIDYVKKYAIKLLQFSNDNPLESKEALKKLLPDVDIVLNCAVRRPDLPREKLEYLIDREMIASMKPGSVVSDTTACDKDLVETAVSHESLHDFYTVDDVIHYNCDHIPSYVGRSATELLSAQTFPYILEMANQGVVKTIQSNSGIRKGTSSYKGHFTHLYTANKKSIPYTDILEIL